MAIALANSGHIALLAGQIEEAGDLCGRAAEEARRTGDLDLVATASLNYASALLQSGQVEEAEHPAAEALGYFTAVGNHWRRIASFRVLGDVHGATGDPESARLCYVRALQLARKIGARAEATKLEGCLAGLSPPAGGDSVSESPSRV